MVANSMNKIFNNAVISSFLKSLMLTALTILAYSSDISPKVKITSVPVIKIPFAFPVHAPGESLSVQIVSICVNNRVIEPLPFDFIGLFDDGVGYYGSGINYFGFIIENETMTLYGRGASQALSQWKITDNFAAVMKIVIKYRFKARADLGEYEVSWGITKVKD